MYLATQGQSGLTWSPVVLGGCHGLREDGWCEDLEIATRGPLHIAMAGR